MSTESGEEGGLAEAIVLEFLPHGRSEDDRPQYRKQPLAYAMGTESFDLYELVIEEDADVAFGDRVDPAGDQVVQANTVTYDDLPSGAG